MPAETTKRKIIDAHAHVFPPAVAEKASAAIGSFYGAGMGEDGTLETLLRQGEQAGVGHFLIHSVATLPRQVQSINNFIAESVRDHPGKLTGFGALHPDYDDLEGEIARMEELGLKGVKLHPDFQEFPLDSLPALRMFEMLEGRLPVLVHTGDYRYDHSSPERMAAVLEQFPRLDVIGAHFGGWSVWERAERCLLDKRIWVDTSSSLFGHSPRWGREMIRRWGADRVFYGTDYPMWRQAEELERFDALELTEEEREKTLHTNLRDFLSIDF